MKDDEALLSDNDENNSGTRLSQAIAEENNHAQKLNTQEQLQESTLVENR